MDRLPPNSHTADTVSRADMSKPVLTYLQHLEALPKATPRNGVSYTTHNYRYGCGEDGPVSLSERQAAYASLMAEGYNDMIECYVKAGYAYHTAFAKLDKRDTLKKIKDELGAKAKKALTPSVTKLMNYLRYDGAEELMIDAKWLLNEQVSLYTECREKQMYTQAVRLLHDISYHVDVDARVSNKVEVEQTIDYAALLQSADQRVSQQALPKASEPSTSQAIETAEEDGVLIEVDTPVVSTQG